MEANHSEWILQCELYFGYQGTDVQVGAHMVTLELQLRSPGFVLFTVSKNGSTNITCSIQHPYLVINVIF